MTNERLLNALAILSLLHQAAGRILSSETIGKELDLNPVVVRRILGRLANAKILRTNRGPGGGVCLNKPLWSVTVLSVWSALPQPPSPFASDNTRLFSHIDQRALRQLNAQLDSSRSQQLASFRVADLLPSRMRRSTS